jgi:hypothetical protein
VTKTAGTDTPPEPVPTVADLVAMGKDFAFATDWTADGKASKWHITDKGHALIGAAMRQRALAAIARGEGNWHQPPSTFAPVAAAEAENLELGAAVRPSAASDPQNG